MDVGFTGTQRGMTLRQCSALRTQLRALRFMSDRVTFHHGGCIGADEQAHQIALDRNYYIAVHPPTNMSKAIRYSSDEKMEVWTQQSYLDRNRDIVEMSNYLIAAPKSLNEEKRSGTWFTIRYARKMGIPVVILDP